MGRFLMRLGFNKSEAYPDLYYKVVDDQPMIVLLYVDDLFLIGDENIIDECKREITTEYEMKYLGMMYYLLSLEVW